ncbi:MAG: hypothetical protein GC182_22475, partial [Rhodopseudomonas sp.]|nr:hypothetical protein [Rhodopseudomonas sp.]
LRDEYSTTITNAHQLQLMALDLTASYTLANNIDASGTAGTSDIWGSAGFSTLDMLFGTLDGQGHTINNLTINRASTDRVGLFYGVNSGARISNLGLVNASVTGGSYVGALAGMNGGGTISNVYVTGSVTGSGTLVGGLVGQNADGTIAGSYSTAAVNGGTQYAGGLVGFNSATISNSYATGTISGASYVGGLVGDNAGTITGAYATGTATATGDYAGGFVGYNVGTINDSYAVGAASGVNYVGGFSGGNASTLDNVYATGSATASGNYAGGLAGNNAGTIRYAYAIGDVSGVDYVGGLVGNNADSITQTYASGAVSGTADTGGLVGRNVGTVTSSYFDTGTTGQSAGVGTDLGLGTSVTGLTTAQALTQSSYSAFDFTSGGAWYMVSGSTRPFLRSEYSTTITNAHQLQLMGMDLTASYTLANNIDASATAGSDASGMWTTVGFSPVGNENGTFKGTFDGQGHTITGLTINRPSTTYVALFGQTENATVKNVGLVGGSVIGQDEVGGLVGFAHGATTISNAYNTGTVQAGSYAGGLVGIIEQTGSISNSYATGSVTASGGTVGGLVGDNAGTITESYATGNVVSTSGTMIGGLVGLNSGPLTQVYATGSVSGYDTVGGLVGQNSSGSISYAYARGSVTGTNLNVGGLIGTNILSSGTITQTYATGFVSGAGSVGGLIGRNNLNGLGSMSANYWDIATTGQSAGVGKVVSQSTTGISGVSTAQLQVALPYDFTNTIWGIVAGQSYPYLLWQFSASGGTPQVISGYAYNADNSAAKGATIAALVDGTNVGSVTAGANGYYNILVAPGTIAGNQVAAYTTGTNAGITYQQDAATSLTGFTIYGGYLKEMSSATSMSAISAGLATALGSSGVSTTLANRWIVDTGANFTIDEAISQTGILTLNVAGDVTQSAGAAIKAYYLALQKSSAAASFTLLDTGNTVTYLGTTNLGAGSLSLYDKTNLVINGAITANGGVLIRSAGALSLYGAVSSSASGNAVVLDAGTNFSNSAGASAISTPNGRWIVYSNSPTYDLFGNLDSGNYAIFGATSATLGYDSVSAGNRYVFAQSPVLTVTSISDSKTYGDVADVSSDYVITGFKGVANAFLTDTAATSLSGLLSVTSAGTAADASVSGGPYTITVSQGSLASLNGYSFSFVSSGKLTVNKADLTVTVNNDSKTYDGLAYSGGNGVTYAGFVNGEDASVLTGSVSYAGTAQGAVNAGGYTLTASGQTSSNYNISYVSGALTVDKATVTLAGSKTYDGMTDFAASAFGTISTGINGETLTLTGSGSLASANVAAGTQTLNLGSLTLANGTGLASNYQIATTGNTGKVTPADLTVTVNNDSKTYDGLAYSGGNGVTYAGFANGEDASVLTGSVSYGGTAQGAVNAGGYTLTASGQTSSNYNISYVSGALTVDKATVTLAGSKTYDGMTDFAASAFGTISTGINGETLTLTGSGSLASANVAAGTQTLNLGSLTLANGTGLASNYQIATTGNTGKVTPANLTVAVNNDSKTYDGLAYSGGNGVTYSGFVHGEDASVLTGSVSYGGTAQGAVNAGGYTLTASGQASSNYNIAYVAGTLTVNKADLTVTANSTSKTYGTDVTFAGTEYTTSGTLYGGDTVTSVTLASAGAAATANAAGLPYAITASNAQGSGLSNYRITYVNGSLQVYQKMLTVTASNTSKQYGTALALSGTTGFTTSGLVNGDSVDQVDFSSSGLAATAAANTYQLNVSNATGSGLSNYVVFYTAGLLNVTRAPLTVTSTDQVKTYGTAYDLGSTGFTVTGTLYNGDAVTGATLTSGAAAATAASGWQMIYVNNAIGSGLSNYSITYVNTGKLTVNQATLTVTANDRSKTYGDSLSLGSTDFTVTGTLYNGDTLTSAVLTSSGAGAGAAASSTPYAIVANYAQGTGLYNYKITYVNGGLTVNKADLTVTANNDSKTYDGLAYSGGNGVTYSGFVNGQTASVLGGALSYGGTAQGAVNAGSYTLTASGQTSSNYNITYVAGTLTVNKADLTVTANNDSKTYDGLAYSGGNGVSYSGFVNGETASVLGGSLSYGGTAQNAVNAGGYTLTASGQTSSNYNIAYVAGTLTVNKADLTVTANNDSKTYDGLAYNGGNGVAYSGFVNGETASVLGGSLSYGGTAQNAVNAGSYTLTASGQTSSNYNIAYVGGTLTVNKADLTVTADAQSKYVGETDPALTYQITGGSLFGTDTLSGALTRVAGEGVGDYDILQGTLAASNNYLLSYIGARLSVLAVPATADNGGDGGYATSQYGAPAGGQSPAIVNISYQAGPSTSPAIIVVRPVNVAGTTPDTTTAATVDPSQNIAPGSGPIDLFAPISQFDRTQYSTDALPDYAPEASQATVLAIIGRAAANNRTDPKIDRLWRDGGATWSNLTEAIARTATFSDGHGNARTPAGDNGFAFDNGKTDIGALLTQGPVMLGGTKAADGNMGTPWLLALQMTPDGKGIVADDPITGRQVVVAYDAATKTVGGVTGVIDPATKQVVPLGEAAPSESHIPPAAWQALKSFQPASYFAVAL